MKVILRDDVKDLGRAGDTVSVAEGYGRNYLLPKKLAVVATPATIKRLEQELNGKKGKERRVIRDAQSLAERLGGEPLVIATNVGEGGKLFGSVTSADIEQALAARSFEIDKRKIELEDAIKTVGTYTVTVKLHADVAAKLTVQVVDKNPAPAAEKTPAPPAKAEDAKTEN
jgi:large subunit ribosomal protein L9